MKINSHALKYYFHVMKYYSHVMRIFFLPKIYYFFVVIKNCMFGSESVFL
jgi:hypothetical protein